MERGPAWRDACVVSAIRELHDACKILALTQADPDRRDVYIQGTWDSSRAALERAAEHAAERLAVPAAQIKELLSAGRVLRVRSRLGWDLADKLVAMLSEAGICALHQASGTPKPDDIRARAVRAAAELSEVSTAKVRKEVDGHIAEVVTGEHPLLPKRRDG